MNKLNRNAIVPYSAEQMFELVDTIEAYPEFLPWCQSAEIKSRADNEVIASLEVAWKGVHKQFTTRNVLYPHERIEISLANGPLKHMEGIWEFKALNDKACHINLDLEFQFTGSLIDRLFQPIFQHIANTLVEAFCKRAVDLYHEKN